LLPRPLVPDGGFGGYGSVVSFFKLRFVTKRFLCCTFHLSFVIRQQKTCGEPLQMLKKKFVVCVDGVYVKGGKILLFRRAVEPFNGCWHVAGGHVEENESLKEALKREFKEETGLDVSLGGIIDGRIEETFDRIKVIVAFEVTSAEGEIRLNSENEAYGWFNEVPCDSVYDYTKYLPKL
jgi:ADP-ribose pyrophosphatase YjhB (NUDIX family)